MNKSFIKKYLQSLAAALGVLAVVFLVIMGIDFTGGATKLRQENGTDMALGNGGIVNVLIMCTDADGLRTDAMMLISYDTEENTINMLSVPRDMRMYIGNRYQKVNAAHAFSTDGEIAGALGACEAVSRITGVPINYYIDFSFATMEKVMDKIGPIEFEIPDVGNDGVGMVYDDPAQDLHINLPPGVRQLNGKEVVHLLRYRKGNNGKQGYADGDIGRIKMQQSFIKAFVDQKLNITLISKLPDIFTDVMNEVDTNLKVSDVIKYSKYLTNFTSAGIRTETIPRDPVHEEATGDVLVPNMEALKALINDMFKNADTSDVKYTNPNETPKLQSDGYMTSGGYVRTTNKTTLSGMKPSQLTNDELCILNGVTQVYTPDPTETPIETPTE